MLRCACSSRSTCQNSTLKVLGCRVYVLWNPGGGDGCDAADNGIKRHACEISETKVTGLWGEGGGEGGGGRERTSFAALCATAHVPRGGMYVAATGCCCLTHRKRERGKDERGHRRLACEYRARCSNTIAFGGACAILMILADARSWPWVARSRSREFVLCCCRNAISQVPHSTDR